jgi:hypothetical protein
VDSLSKGEITSSTGALGRCVIIDSGNRPIRRSSPGPTNLSPGNHEYR